MNQIANQSVQEFLINLKKDESAVLLDVRRPDEIKDGTIDGAININFQGEQFENEIKHLNKDKTYFVYCRSGRRSMNACIAMKKIGIKNTINLDGGYIAFISK